MAESGEKLFEDARGEIEQALRFVAFRRRLPPSDMEELRSFVSWKLVENDYARLRKHRAHGSMAAYLGVVVHRLYLDFQISRWGKWHPSAEALRRGGTAVALERLVYRDGFEVREAVELVRTSEHVPSSREDLSRLVYALPVRHRPHFVAEEHLYGANATPAVDPIERREREDRAKRLQNELMRAMALLDAEDRRMLEMRFGEKRTISEIAELLGVQAKPLYSKIRRLLDFVRARLESEGFGDDAISLSDVAMPAIDLEGVFDETAA